MRPIDVSQFGKITGIWQIGPIVSLDRWIPDQLAPELGILPHPAVQLPDPTYEYFVDYAVFHGDGPQNLEQLSDDFDVPGYEGTDQKWFQEGNAITETFSHRGYLTVTLMGMNGMWGMAPALSADMPGGLGYVDVKKFKPPWEIETSFVAPDEDTLASKIDYALQSLTDNGVLARIVMKYSPDYLVPAPGYVKPN